MNALSLDGGFQKAENFQRGVHGVVMFDQLCIHFEGLSETLIDLIRILEQVLYDDHAAQIARVTQGTEKVENFPG
jgi:hypothetical protein